MVHACFQERHRQPCTRQQPPVEQAAGVAVSKGALRVCKQATLQALLQEGRLPVVICAEHHPVTGTGHFVGFQNRARWTDVTGITLVPNARIASAVAFHQRLSIVLGGIVNDQYRKIGKGLLQHRVETAAEKAAVVVGWNDDVDAVHEGVHEYAGDCASGCC